MFRFLRRRAREEDLQREIAAHLELEAEEQEEAGVSREEAQFAARRALGNVAAVAEQTREAWGWGWLERLLQDLSFGMRLLGKAPGFTAVVVLTLALGIGANSAIFSIVNAVLLEPLPYRDAERLVVIEVHPPHNPGVHAMDTYQDFEAWKARSHSFAQLAAATFLNGGRIFEGGDGAREVLAMPVSIEFFPLLGVSPQIGRSFQADDLRRGCTVVLRHRFWASALGGGRKIVGRSIRLSNQSCTVVGVMPPGFTFYADLFSMWRLLTPQDEMVRHAAHSMVIVYGRLKPGVTEESAAKELRTIYADVHRHDAEQQRLVPVVYPLKAEFTFLTGANLRLSLLVLFGAVVMVLLIACVNVANLLLGRSLGRTREFAVRTALGAGRMRLIRQLLTECLLLSLLGAGLGIVFAWAQCLCFGRQTRSGCRRA